MALCVASCAAAEKIPGQDATVGTGDSPNYFRQTTDEQNLNNGQTYMSIVGPLQVFGAGGKEHMYPQNLIHKWKHEKQFLSTATGL